MAELTTDTAMGVGTCESIVSNLFLMIYKSTSWPNDGEEQERLDMMHEMMLAMMDRKLFLAPVGNSPRRVLDLGTGTGIWAIDFGKRWLDRRFATQIHLRWQVISFLLQRYDISSPMFNNHCTLANFSCLGHWYGPEPYSTFTVSNLIHFFDSVN